MRLVQGFHDEPGREKNVASSPAPCAPRPSSTRAPRRTKEGGVHRLWTKLASWGVELRGIKPVPEEERTDTHFISILSLWASMSTNPLPIITGMSGTLSYQLSLRDASLVILFFSLLCVIPPAYLSTLGPRTGLRQMIQARYSFGLYGVCVPVVLNLATITGFTIISCIVGGQTLAAVTSGSLSVSVGIVIISLVGLLISFCGYRVLHQYERYAWVLGLVSIIIATGCGGKHLSQQQSVPAPTAATILSFGSLVAGFLISWGPLGSDFTTYFRKDAPPTRIFAYVYLGLAVPTILLMVLGAAIGGATPNIPSWSTGYARDSAGGALAAMLAPAGGFGKFIVVVLAFSIVSNIAASLYSISLSVQTLQVLVPILESVQIPRAFFAVAVIAVIIPVAIKAASSFFDSLQNFLGLISYWAAAFVAIVFVEHMWFRRRECASYAHEAWDVARKLPVGAAALAAGVLSFALVIPCMDQIWYVGPIAKSTGDIGFEVAFCVSAILYMPLRAMELRRWGR